MVIYEYFMGLVFLVFFHPVTDKDKFIEDVFPGCFLTRFRSKDVLF